MKNSENSTPENKNNSSTPEPLPPSIKRRRKNHRLYKRKSKTATYDKMIVAVAFLVAVFMVMTKGCAGPIQNLGKLFGGQSTEQTKTDTSETNQPEPSAQEPK